MTSSRVPVFLLTGFLGSGKTTLLNRLMRARPHTRGKLAIVVNEFGAVGIDGDLLPADMTRQVELPGGCICCVLNEELDSTLLALLADNPDIETIVIETTGIAEPLPISWSLARAPVSERVRLAAVITVVDASNFLSCRPLSPSVDAQVEYADLLVVSKLDLVGGAVGEDLGTALRDLNDEALWVTGRPDEVTSILWQTIADPELPSGSQAIRSGRISDPAHTHHRHDDDDGHDHEHGYRPGSSPGGAASEGLHGFETIWLPIEKLIDFEELSEQLEALPKNYVRIKGIAYAIDASTGSSEPRWLAFHRVGTRVSCEPLDNPADSRVVALGTGMQRSALAACLEAAVVPWSG